MGETGRFLRACNDIDSTSGLNIGQIRAISAADAITECVGDFADNDGSA
jgi:hypothetical protein